MTTTETIFPTRRLGPDVDDIAPDGSEIRKLVRVARGSLCHCTLPAGAITRPVRHRSIEEVWFFLSGRGQVWRKSADGEEVTDVSPGISLAIPTGVSFQFRAAEEEPLCFLITTMPPWPGADEAVPAAGKWEPRAGSA